LPEPRAIIVKPPLAAASIDLCQGLALSPSQSPHQNSCPLVLTQNMIFNISNPLVKRESILFLSLEMAPVFGSNPAVARRLYGSIRPSFWRQWNL
jgi:hypothetical protein